MRRQRTPRGITLIEVLVAMGLVALATLALVSANKFVAVSSSRSYRRYLAMRLAQQRLDTLALGDTKLRLVSTAAVTSLDFSIPVPAKTVVVFPDAVPVDCTETSAPPELCSGAKPDLMGWVDIYGRPCYRDKSAVGYQPTCMFRRYIRYVYEPAPPGQGDQWRILIAVSHAPDGTCGNPKEGDSQCVVTRAVFTR